MSGFLGPRHHHLHVNGKENQLNNLCEYSLGALGLWGANSVSRLDQDCVSACPFKIFYLFMHLIIACVEGHPCGGQRTACWTSFSPSTVWVLRVEHGDQARPQASSTLSLTFFFFFKVLRQDLTLADLKLLILLPQPP